MSFVSSRAGELRFSFIRGTNLEPGRDRHAHTMMHRFLRDGSLQKEVTFYQDDKEIGTIKIVLKRKN